MRKDLLFLCLATCSFFLVLSQPNSARAGADIQINDESSIDLGFRLQALYLRTEKDVDGQKSSFENFDDFKVRRARLRLGADINKWASMFIQTEFAEDEGTGADMRVIDAFIRLKPHKLANIYLGENMAPVTRQNLTSSGGLLAIDRPGITYKNLTWGTRALSTFANATVGDTDAGLRGDVDVRDTGVTLFGSTSLSDMAHVKYYLGTYDGVQEAGEDSERCAGRIQVNFFDAEPNYFNLSTYLGKKKTVGIGAAFDSQSDVARDLATGGTVDYEMWTVDAFADYPLGPGTVTLEAAYLDLDLDDATQLDADGDGITGTNAKQSQGNGYYAQAGYFINNWQPWVEYEQWDSDGANDLGSFDSYRIGLTYFIKGHNANIKAGYEVFNADENFTGTNEDSIKTFVTGLYVNY